MRSSKSSFRHESLQDAKSIQELLKALSKGLAKGQLNFRDEEGEIDLQPEGLLHLKVSASQEGSDNRLNIRVKWKTDEQVSAKKTLSLNDSKLK